MMKKLFHVTLLVLTVIILAGCPIPSSEKTMNTFIFRAVANIDLNSDVIGTINSTDISVIVPYQNNVDALVATFSTSGIDVIVGVTSQDSGITPNNFTNPLIYIIKTADGTLHYYTVTVTIAEAANESSAFSTESSLGDSGVLTLSESAETLTMFYANDSTNITFPTGTDDSGTSTLTTKFWMGETEVTNAVLAAVYQWAYDNEKFSSTVGDHNGLDIDTAKHGGQQLIDLGDGYCRVDYDGTGSFTAESGYENNPVTNVTWYGSVMFCNWLTEMRDGNTANLVYRDIDTDWLDDETTETVSNTGYRLPSSDEWEFAARYRGTDSTNTVSGYTAPCYTQGDSASGATADYSNASACQTVAVYQGSIPSPSDEAAVKSLGAGSTNALGLYDMSGNVWEWCFTEGVIDVSQRVRCGGSWAESANVLQIGERSEYRPYYDSDRVGFRLCRTAD